VHARIIRKTTDNTHFDFAEQRSQIKFNTKIICFSKEHEMPQDGSSSIRVPHQLSGLRIGLVTEEVAGHGSSGGIGAAMLELATALSGAGALVELFHIPSAPLSPAQSEKMALQCAAFGVTLHMIDPGDFVWGEAGPEKRSYSVYCTLLALRAPLDVVHFHDYRGLGFYTQNAKRQGLAFAGTHMVVQVHGPTRWALEANGVLFSQAEQLKADFMERRSIETADWLVCPSQYLLDWMRTHHFALPAPERIRVIPNACSLAASAAIRGGRNDRSRRSAKPSSQPARAVEVILFARHEERKGVGVFLDALDLLNPLLSRRRVQVTMLGGLGELGGHPSGVVLTRRGCRWTFPLSVRTAFDRPSALRYLAQARDAVVVVPSPEENAPYAIIEAALAGLPVVTSKAGGARELLDPALHGALLTDIEAVALAERITYAVETGLPPARLAETPEDIAAAWTSFHLSTCAFARTSKPIAANGRRGGRTTGTKPQSRLSTDGEAGSAQDAAAPTVVLGITHYERPAKLMDAVVSALRQTYAKTSLVVYDDGSRTTKTCERLDQMETLLARCGGRLLRGPNRYLGAARNTILRETSSEFILFLDDDDLALPHMIETLVRAAAATQADIVTCLNLFLNVKDRPLYSNDPSAFNCKFSYAGIGGPLSAAATENCIGPSVALFRRASLERLGGFTELRNVGYEDYELYLRALQAGMKVEVVATPLYLYEIGRPSMISQTDAERNQRRVALAIDITSQPEQWKDAICLLSAQSGLAVKLGRREWEYSIDPHAELLKQLLNRCAFSSEHYANLLSEYATCLGTRQMAEVWRESTATNLPKFDFEACEITESEWDVSEILMLLAGRQQKSAVECCVRLMRHASILDLPLLSVAERVINGVDASECVTHLEGLIETLETARVEPDNHSRRVAVVAQATERLNDQPLATAPLRELYEIEEVLYLKAYPDIKTALGITELQSGLHHYLLAGRHEGRSGFAMLALVAKSLSIETEAGFHEIARRLGVVPSCNGVPTPNLIVPAVDEIAWIPPSASAIGVSLSA
jgi:glycosyltransferase involved in cell wall biosynthesis